MLSRVVFSERAYTAILAETKERISTETGGVFIGIIQDSTWYVVETIDPGPKSIFQYAYFEYDRDYICHLANKINELYSGALSLLGLWHRHPGSMDFFSGTDDETNKRFAEGNETGMTISAIVNIDPKFRMTMYVASGNPIKYRPIEYRVDDMEFKAAGIRLTSHKKIEEQINSRVSQGHRERCDFAKQQQCFITHCPEVDQERLSNTLVQTIKMQPYIPEYLDNLVNDELGFDEIVSQLYDTIEFCLGRGLPITVEQGDNNAVTLIFSFDSVTVTLNFFHIHFSKAFLVTEGEKRQKIKGSKMCFVFEKRLYLYDKKMFKRVLGQH